MHRINDFMKQWWRGVFLLVLVALLIGGAGVQASLSMVPWFGILAVLELTLGWTWLEDYTLWVFGAAVVAWLPYNFALVLVTKTEATEREWAVLQKACQGRDKANGEGEVDVRPRPLVDP